jgi:hypothetical protein
LCRHLPGQTLPFSFRFRTISRSITVGPDNQGATFSAFELYTLSGLVLEGTSGLPNVRVMVGSNLVTTATNGAYSITTLRKGQYHVIPALAATILTIQEPVRERGPR